MTDEQKQRVTVTLPESLVRMLDGAVQDATDYLSLSRSELVGYAAERGVETADDDLLDLIPDALLAEYRVRRHDERVQAEFYVVDKREGWRGRVKSYLNARLAGEEPYHPDGVALLAEGYRQELRTLHRLAPESARSLDEDERWLDDVLDDYRDAWRAKQAVPDAAPFEGVEDKIATGRDLLSLQGDLGALVDDLGAKAESTAYDPDAIVRALASDYGVSEDAVTVVLDVLLPDDVDTRRALKSLESTSVEEILPAEAVEESDGPAPALEGDVVPTSADVGSGDMATQTLSVSLDDLPDDEDAPGVDEDRVEQLVRDEIRANGGGSGD